MRQTDAPAVDLSEGVGQRRAACRAASRLHGADDDLRAPDALGGCGRSRRLASPHSAIQRSVYQGNTLVGVSPDEASRRFH